MSLLNISETYLIFFIVSVFIVFMLLFSFKFYFDSLKRKEKRMTSLIKTWIMLKLHRTCLSNRDIRLELYYTFGKLHVRGYKKSIVFEIENFSLESIQEHLYDELVRIADYFGDDDEIQYQLDHELLMLGIIKEN